MTISDKDRRALIEHRIDKSREALYDAQYLLDGGRCTGAVNRIYYGVFHALSALALRHSFSTSKHRRLIGWFNREFVKPRKVAAEVGEFAHNAYDKRSTGDYDDFARFSVDEVRPMLAKARTVVDRILSLAVE